MLCYVRCTHLDPEAWALDSGADGRATIPSRLHDHPTMLAVEREGQSLYHRFYATAERQAILVLVVTRLMWLATMFNRVRDFRFSHLPFVGRTKPPRESELRQHLPH